MRWYFISIVALCIISGILLYYYTNAKGLIIIISIIGVLNLLAACFYNMIVEIYDEADKMDQSEN
jgi:hypothetical protein